MNKIFKIVIVLILISIITYFGYIQFFHSSGPAKTKKNENSSAPIEISAQLNIIKPGFYQLTADLAPTTLNRSPNSDTCVFFNIKASDVVFDGMGHVIDGSRISPPCTTLNGFGGFGARDASDYQLKNSEDRFLYSRITVRNITVTNIETGFAFSNAHDLRIENVTFVDNHGGIFFQSSSNVSFINNRFINNTNSIQGRDNEQITFSNNIIRNSRTGIIFEGIKPFSPRITIPYLNQQIGLVSFMTEITRTSGSGYMISHNTIQNVSYLGILISDINDVKIIDNILKDNKQNIWVINPGQAFLIENNTGISNDSKITNNPKIFSLTAIIGTILIFLFSILPKILLGPSRITQKIFGTKFANAFTKRIHSIEDSINSVMQNNSFSTVFRKSAITITGVFIFGGAYAYANKVQLIPSTFGTLMIISGVVIVIPRAFQYLIAHKNGLVAEYQMWWGGIFVILVTMLLPLGSIFGQPVKIEISNKELIEDKKILVSKLSGPFVTVLLSFGFYGLLLLKLPFALVGLQMSLLSSVVMLLPISPSEGEFFWNQNKIIWGLVFFPILIVYYVSLLIPI